MASVTDPDNPWLAAAARLVEAAGEPEGPVAGPDQGPGPGVDPGAGLGPGRALAVRTATAPTVSSRPAALRRASGGLPDVEEPRTRIGRWSRPPHPHLGEGDIVSEASWWWLGVHGGAGVSTLARLLPGGADAFRLWPDPGIHAGPEAVILVCRTHMRGLACAQAALHQFDLGQAPAGLRLLGLVAVADAPGKLPAPQARALRLLAGAVDRIWTVGWVEDLRRARDVAGLSLPPTLTRLAASLEEMRPGRVRIRAAGTRR